MYRNHSFKLLQVVLVSSVECRALSVKRRVSSFERRCSNVGRRASGFGCRVLGVKRRALSVEHRASERWHINVEHREFQHRASSVLMSSMGRSSRASGSGQHPTVECQEDGRGDGKVTSLQGYSVGSIECRALIIRSSIPTSRVERSSRASASSLLPTDGCREDGARLWNSDEFAGLQFRQHRASSVRVERLASRVDCREDGRGDEVMKQ
jgi:hypothetical protein